MTPPLTHGAMRGRCDACGYGNTPVREYGDVRVDVGRRFAFCEVCAQTFLSRLATDPDSLRSPLLFFKCLALLGNMLLDAIHELKTGDRR